MIHVHCGLGLVLILVAWQPRFIQCHQSTTTSPFDVQRDTTIDCATYSSSSKSAPRAKRDDASPCPPQHEIAPCVCDPNYNTITCTNVRDEARLEEIFKSDFSHNRITKVEIRNSGVVSLNSGIFGKVKIHDIEIRKNALKSVKANAFAGSELTALYINLNHNQLQDFSFQSVTSVLVLRQLQLAYNHLTEIPERAFGNLTKLDFLALNNNKIERIGEKAFENLFSLTFLDLSHNNILELGSASMNFNPKLQDKTLNIILNENNITYIDRYSFQGSHPTFLALMKNNLASLDRDIFHPLLNSMIHSSTLVGLALQGNPIKCDCHIKWLLEDPRLTKPLRRFQCVDGTPLSNLTFEYLTCT